MRYASKHHGAGVVAEQVGRIPACGSLARRTSPSRALAVVRLFAAERVRRAAAAGGLEWLATGLLPREDNHDHPHASS
jgi:hypothetical protein